MQFFRVKPNSKWMRERNMESYLDWKLKHVRNVLVLTNDTEKRLLKARKGGVESED
jgi:hypothetical protein